MRQYDFEKLKQETNVRLWLDPKGTGDVGGLILAFKRATIKYGSSEHLTEDENTKLNQLILDAVNFVQNSNPKYKDNNRYLSSGDLDKFKEAYLEKLNEVIDQHNIDVEAGPKTKLR